MKYYIFLSVFVLSWFALTAIAIRFADRVEQKSRKRRHKEIIQAAKLGIAIDGATMYCTHQPCSICAKMIVNAGIIRVVYKHPYPDEFANKIFDMVEIQVEQYKE